MNADMDALATRLYVTIDDLLKDHPHWQPERPVIGIAPQLSDAELITLAVIQALLGVARQEDGIGPLFRQFWDHLGSTRCGAVDGSTRCHRSIGFREWPWCSGGFVCLRSEKFCGEALGRMGVLAGVDRTTVR